MLDIGSPELSRVNLVIGGDAWVRRRLDLRPAGLGSPQGALDQDGQTRRPRDRPAVIESFERIMRENITSGDPSFRKACIPAVADRAEVDDKGVGSVGDKVTLEKPAAGLSLAADGVRRCVPKWRARPSSNSIRRA